MDIIIKMLKKIVQIIIFYRNNKLKNNKIHESNLLEKEYDEYFHDKY